ncbi:MAG: ATP-binding cassette domain-containing protein [Rhodospirillaceae bacterium]|nr:ATP-binding cassette domain-containing protein [Rhodospirillales bacterium]
MTDGTGASGPLPLGERVLNSIAALSPPRLSKLTSGDAGLLELRSPMGVLLLATLAGLAGAGVLITLTSGLKEGSSALVGGLAFVVLIVAYRWLQRKLLKSTSAAVEAALSRMRTRLAAKVVRLDLRDFEEIPHEELQAKMARHYEVISEAVVGILGGLQSAGLLILTLIYLATISVLAAGLSILVLGVAIHAYFSSREEMQKRMRAAHEAETALLGSLGEIIDGFKELRLHFGKRVEVLDELTKHSARSAKERTITQGMFADLFVFSNTIAFLLGGAVVFLVPLISGDTSSEDVARVVTIVLFIIGPLSAIVSATQHFHTARFAITSLREFEIKLDATLQPEPPQLPVPEFQSLRIEAARFKHHAIKETTFAIGPFDLHVAKGEMVFITGGNGSGKTTAMRLMVGLYPPESGRIMLNDMPLAAEPQALEAYRQLFGTVFADAHVFRRPYALPEERWPVLTELLERFQIASKLPGDLMAGYNPNALSTGQRKRLAMALTLAEDRPVMVFDEWAADQDPQFRHYFYETLLPELKQAGKAIIAITHDDRYFDAADRRYHMEEGQVTLVAEKCPT